MPTKEKRLTNEVTVVGFIETISDIVERGNKGTEIITVRLKQPGQYENVLDIEFFNDKIDDVLEFDDVPNARVRIRASINGRLWQKKLSDGSPDYKAKPVLFLSLTGWSIKADDEPVATKDRRSRRKSKHEDEQSDDMPGDMVDEMPTPESEKSSKRKARTAQVDESIRPKDDVPY